METNISFYSEEVDFDFDNHSNYIDWLLKTAQDESKVCGELSFVFCTDEYLHKMNVEYLNHDTLTDIITFDYSEENVVSGDIFISIDRVRENAVEFGSTFHVELLRVMSHGVLHYLGFKDKADQDVLVMRNQEDIAIKLFNEFHVEQ